MSSIRIGRLARAAEERGHVRDAGYVKIEDKSYKVPIGTWPKLESFKKAELYNMAIIHDFLSAASAPFTRGLGWSTEELEVFLTDARKCVKDRSMHTYCTFHMVIGQKPSGAT
jgi:hypothetical protein